jgi:hypothetical protein
MQRKRLGRRGVAKVYARLLRKDRTLTQEGNDEKETDARVS